MAIRPRLTKSAVLAEINILRDKLRKYMSMTTDELEKDFIASYYEFGHAPQKPSRELMIGSLMMSATYYMTNVLDLE